MEITSFLQIITFISHLHGLCKRPAARKFFLLYRKKHLTNANFRRILRGKLKPLMQTSKQTGFLPESCRVVRVQQKDVCRMDCGGQAEREGK